jgi:hypothetical protein
MPARRRLLLVAVVSTAVVLVVGLTAWLFLPRTAITRENAARIQVGMAVAEVVAILGGPARDESSGPLASAAEPQSDDQTDQQLALLFRNPLTGRLVPSLLWESDRDIVRIDLDAEGHVGGCDCLAVRRLHESIPDRLRRWLGL